MPKCGVITYQYNLSHYVANVKDESYISGRDMILGRVKIVDFRGISRLSLMLEQNNVLIGKDAWGRSSLLDALALLLSPEPELYHFERDGSWFPPGDIDGREHHLRIILTFRRSLPGRHRVRHCRPLEACWVPCTNGYHRIFYRLERENAEDGSVMTLRSFLDKDGHPIDVEDVNDQARHLVRLMSVLRLHDAHFMRRIRNGTVPNVPNVEVTVRRLDFLTCELSSHPQNLPDGQVRQGFSAMVQLPEHYFSKQRAGQARYRLVQRRTSNEQRGWRYLDTINRMIDRPGGCSYRAILLGLLVTLLQAKGTLQLDKDAYPLLLVKDPEARLHPIMLSVTWRLLNPLPLQRTATTNSGELFSLTPVERVCRLIRESSRVAAWRLGPSGLGTENSRRTSFHTRFNRPSSLFARYRLLVEGETETWVINELACQCGHHFDIEGIKVIEFVQFGLKPLIKLARRMGVEWHVLVDDDETGKKHAATIRSLLNNGRGTEQGHLTALPTLDMEHFMYRQGFSDMFHHVAQIPGNVPMSLRKVVSKAIHRSSKPDLAIEVIMEAGRRGVDSTPTLLKETFSRVLWLVRGQVD